MIMRVITFIFVLFSGLNMFAGAWFVAAVIFSDDRDGLLVPISKFRLGLIVGFLSIAWYAWTIILVRSRFMSVNQSPALQHLTEEMKIESQS